MKKSLAKKSLVLIALLAVVCMAGISYAEDTSQTKPAAEKGAPLQQLEAAAGKTIEGTKMPGPKGFTVETSSITASNYDVNKSTMTAASRTKGRDGAACSSNDECERVCEGGSCCTNYGDPCDSSSHCCGHQSCTKDGTCPK